MREYELINKGKGPLEKEVEDEERKKKKRRKRGEIMMIRFNINRLLCECPRKQQGGR